MKFAEYDYICAGGPYPGLHRADELWILSNCAFRVCRRLPHRCAGRSDRTATNTKTELGAFLDPMADKLLIVTSFVTLALLGNIPAWLVIIVISRDVILLLGGSVIHFTGRRLIIQPSVLGKITTFCSCWLSPPLWFSSPTGSKRRPYSREPIG